MRPDHRFMKSSSSPSLLVLCVLALAACEKSKTSKDDVNDGDPNLPPGIVVPAPPPETSVGPGGIRRLSRDELDNTLRDLLGDTSRPAFSALPEDSMDPFDNDYRTQASSPAIIEAVEGLANAAAERAMADPARREAIVPCTPAGPEDAACMRTFVTTFGRRAFRRPLTEAEINRFMSLQSFAAESGDFHQGASLVISAMLQSPSFLYLVEVGRPVKGDASLSKLQPFELAARLSYFLWGSMPDDALLDAAASGKLGTAEQVRAQAARMLDDPRATERIKRFHALWLGYHQLPHDPALAEAMLAETDALIERSVKPGVDYFSIFRAEETYVGDQLAAHYGLRKEKGGAAWTSYAGTGRRGILSHGSVLSAFAKKGDTSPTQRGIFIRERLLCTPIPPPPSNVNADVDPSSENGPCKKQRYADHANVGSCKGCHQLMDPIGFGLENYDKSGKYRTHDDGLPECPIDGAGELTGVGNFNGPAELGDRLIESGQLEACVVRQMFRFALGRHDEFEDEPTIQRLAESFKASQRDFRSMLVELAGSDAFIYRKSE